MVNLQDKYIIFNFGYVEDYFRYRKYLYYRVKYYFDGSIENNSIEHIEEVIQHYENLFLTEEHLHYFDCARRTYNARKEKVRRLRKKMKYLLSMGECLFCTFTFNEDSLSNLSPKTRRRYVSSFLLSNSKFYIANIDFGDSTEREHYHAVILKDFIPAGSFPYGFDYYEKIKIDFNNRSDTVHKVSKYLNKIVNHSVKISTGCSNIIFSDYVTHIEELYYTVKSPLVLEEVEDKNLIEEIDNIF